MASIVKKKVRGHLYYYLVQSQRVNGKPRIVWQKYLGKAEDVARILAEGTAPQPETVKVFEFGAVAALYSLAQQLKLVETIDAHVPKRAQGASVGQYLLIATLNRCLAPKSKRQIAQWYASTSLHRWLGIKPELLTSQRFWDHMGYLGEQEIRQIEEELTRRIVETYHLDLRCLVYDTTNFFTYIDTNTDSELPRRGKSKAKRNDLKQVGLALLVSTDFHVPLFHAPYAGNIHDSVEFKAVTTDLVDRYRLVSKECEHITLVYDKGNNSADNLAALQQSPYHFVGSLVPSQHKDLLAIPRQEFTPLVGERFEGVYAHRTQKKVFGVERTVVVTFNEALLTGQMQGIHANLQKTMAALEQLRQKLKDRAEGKVTRGKAPTAQSTLALVRRLLAKRHTSGLIRVEIMEKTSQRKPQIELSYALDQEALQNLKEHSLGKTILFTDNSSWTTEEIVAAYRGQSAVEDAFKRMKDPHFLSWSPMFHWTDQKIRVHAFYCVLALTICSLLRRELHGLGIELSIPAVLEMLSNIHEVALVYPGRGRRKNPLVLSERNQLQQKIFDALHLEKLAPTT